MLPSGLTLPLGSMIDKLRRKKMMREILLERVSQGEKQGRVGREEVLVGRGRAGRGREGEAGRGREGGEDRRSQGGRARGRLGG